MVKLFILVGQKPNFEQDLMIIKVHTGPIEKNVKYHSSVFMNIMGNTVIMGLMIGSSHFLNNVEHTKEKMEAVEREGNILAIPA